MPLDAIFGTTVELLGKSIDLRAKNHGFISANLANAETPGYLPTVLSFEGDLKEALRKKGSTVQATPHPRHIPLKGATALAGVREKAVEVSAGSPGRDGNGVELEAEMGRMIENQIMYNASIQILAKRFEGVRYAIKGGS